MMAAHKLVPRARARIAERTEFHGDCQMWTGALDKDGYAITGLVGYQWRVHRLNYILEVGIPRDDQQIDHLCRNRACVLPAHLEAVSPRENTLRGESPTIRVYHSGHCAAGHPRTPENVKIRRDGTRICRPCTRLYMADWQRRSRASKRGAA